MNFIHDDVNDDVNYDVGHGICDMNHVKIHIQFFK